jgi:hypothetical protein
LRTGREIIEIERRARASAEKRGEGDELAEVEEPVVAREVSDGVSDGGYLEDEADTGSRDDAES